MSIPIAILTPNGLIDAPYTAESFAEAAKHEPKGVYTVARTFKRDQTLLLDDHLNRLEQSARLENITVTLDRPVLRRALKTLIDRSGYAESRFRITIPHEQPDHLYLSLEPFKPVPPEILANGARVITVHKERQNPTAKTTAWMDARATITLPQGIYEGILLSHDDYLLEGLSSNFYAILEGSLRTANEGVLAGIARHALLSVAAGIVPVSLYPVKLSDLPLLSEAFLTSAGRGVVPIVEIDGQPIGEGNPGALTRALQNAYNAWADAHLESLVNAP